MVEAATLVSARGRRKGDEGEGRGGEGRGGEGGGGGEGGRGEGTDQLGSESAQEVHVHVISNSSYSCNSH